MHTPNSKQSIYIPDAQLLEIEREADRQDRSMSWVVQVAWRIAHKHLQEFPDSPLPRPAGDSARRRTGAARAKRKARTLPPPEPTPKPLAQRLERLAGQRRERRRAAADAARPPPPPRPMQDQAPHAGTRLGHEWAAHLQDHRESP